jgi:hypothetical protein
MVKVSKGRRLQQVLGIAVMIAIWIMIVTKGYTDISWLWVTEADDFWRALAKYFLNNMVPPGAGEQGMCYGPGSCSRSQ